MRILEIKNTGSIPFPHGVSWKPGDDSKIALIGNNGSGKTTLLDTLCMAFYGITPNRESESGREEGAIYGCFKEKNSSVEVRILIHGKEIHVKRLINPSSRNQKPYLYVNGKAVTEGKVEEFNQAFLKETGLSKEIFLSTVYHSQKGKGHLTSLGQSDARTLLDQILGFGKWDSEFKFFDTKRLELEKDLAGDSFAISQLEQKIQEKPALQKELDQVNLDKTSKELEITKNDDSYKVATQTLANLKSQSFDLASIMQERITLGNEIESATESVLDLTQRLVNNQKLLSEESVIREAAKLLTVQLELSELKSTELQEAKSQYEIEATSVKSELYALRTEVEGIDTDLSTLSVTTKERTESLSKSESEIASLESKLTQFQNKASLLERVPCSGVTVNSRVLSEECELLKDAVQGKKEISAIEEILIELRAKRLKLWKEIDSLVKEKENLDRKKFLKSDLIKNLDFNFQNSELGRKIKDLELESGAIQVDITKLREQTKNLAQLDFAQERIDGYKKQIAELTQSKDAKSTRLTEIQTLIDSKSEESKAIEIAEQELKNLESNLKSLKSELETLIRNASRIDEKLSEIQKSETKLKSLKESDKSHKLTGLKLLCEGLSPKGARALMIDAAGPGISASINSVLSACYGTRFQVYLRTTKETGKGTTKEEVSLMVLDEETGDESLVTNKSGGEASIIKEGISLGAAVYQQQKSGTEIKTLIRDEADGGLTQDNAVLYQKMLDRAMNLGGFEQVIYVSHKPEVQRLASKIYLVKDQAILPVTEQAVF